MIPPGHTVKIGEAVVAKATGLLFHAKCSCPSSRPLEHTARYVNNHRDLFDLPVSSTLPAPPTTQGS